MYETDIWATEDGKGSKSENHEKYDSAAYHQHHNYIQKGQMINKHKKMGL